MRKMKFFGLLLSFFLLIGTGIGLSAAFGDITVKLTYNVDNVDIKQADFSQAHGTTLTHEAPLNVGDSGDFNYWLVNGILRTDLARKLSIVTRSTTELVAVYGHPTNPTVTFIDSNGKYINHLFVESGSVVAEASVPAAPGKPQSTFAGWKGLGSSVVISDPITSNTVFIAIYTENEVTAELVVDGGTPTTYPINSVVSLTLGEGFTHWEDGDGNVLSYAETFKFSMLVANREVVRATGGVKAPVVNMIAETGLREGYTSYIGQFDSNGLDVIEYGFIVSDLSEANLTLETPNIIVIPSNVYYINTNEFLRSFPADSYNSIRAYAIFKDGETQIVKYSGNEISLLDTILEVRSYAKGDPVTTKGIVTGIQYRNGNPLDGIRTVIISDNTAAIHLYQPSGSVEIGDMIKVSGTIDVYNGLFQVGNGGVMTVLSQNNTLPTVTQLTSFSGLDITNQGYRISIEDLQVKTISGSNLTITDGLNDVVVYFDANVPSEANILSSLSIGDRVNLDNIHVGWYNALQLLPFKVGDIVKRELTDAQKVALDHAALSIELNVLGAGDMGLPLIGTKGSVITWESDNLAVITNDGVVTLPEEGTTVKMTATLTIGTESLTKEFNVVVPAEGAEVEAVIYETGFEAPDFTAATAYNLPETLKGPAGLQWAVRYGTPATTGAISGAQSLQMRWYRAASGSYTTDPIYAYTAFQSTNATKITFSSANYGKGGKVEVTISVDGGATWIAPEVFTLTNKKAEYTYDVPEANQTGAVQFKFTYVVTDPIPTADDRLYIDDVKIYGMVAPG